MNTASSDAGRLCQYVGMNRDKHFSLKLIKVIYLAAVFLVALVILSSLMNRGNTDMTMEMPPASYPTVTFTTDGMLYNRMFARVQEADITKLREHLTPVGDHRELSLVIDTYGTDVRGLSFQVRSLMDGRLIEDTPIYDYVHNGERISADFALKDLIRSDIEYSLCIIIETQRGEKLHYYTNILRNDEIDIREKLEYAFYFDRMSYDRVHAGEELPTYLESNARGDNSTFHFVDIHSSLQQVTWGNLNISPLTEAVATIGEMETDTAELMLDYIAEIPSDRSPTYYLIHEYYRIRQGSERMYLLGYERTMEEIFDRESWIIANNKISLGIADKNVPMVESKDGNYLAFVASGRLYSYDISGNKLADIFSFYDSSDVKDPRTTRQDYEIRVFQADETGNVRFMVCGNMNCGIHEGYCGVSVFYYDSLQNTIEEELFIPYDGDFDHLKAELSGVCYANNAEKCYLAFGGNVYEIRLESHYVRTLAESGKISHLQASDSGRCIAWSEGTDPYASQSIVYMDLDRGQEQRIRAEEGKYIMPLGFFGDDLIYGEAQKNDVVADASGRVFFPMDKVCIQGIAGRLLKEYSEENVYISSAELIDDLIMLHRQRRDEDGNMVEIPNDQILNNNEGTGSKNTIETAVTENYETLVQIALRSEINTAAMQLLDPRQVIYEGERTVIIDRSRNVPPQYCYYERGELLAEYTDAYEAFARAYEGSGIVRTPRMQFLYRKRSLPQRNQIMAITGKALGKEATPAELRTECISELLGFAGSAESVTGTISSRQSAVSMISQALPGAEVIDLSGITLEQVLAFPAEEIPVLAELADGSAMLIIGFNDREVVVMDPSAEEIPVYKLGRNEAAEFFAENGNRFISYRKFAD